MVPTNLGMICITVLIFSFQSTLSDIVVHTIVPLDTHDIYAKGNMASISSTFSIEISHTPGKIENVNISADCSPEKILIYIDLFKEFQDEFAWSYEEMLGINPRIVEYGIKTYQPSYCRT
jgi:hypothetical protein